MLEAGVGTGFPLTVWIALQAWFLGEITVHEAVELVDWFPDMSVIKEVY